MIRPIIDKSAPKMPTVAVTAAPACGGKASTGTSCKAWLRVSKHEPKLRIEPQIVRLLSGLFDSKSAILLSLSMIHVIEILAPFAT